uniref:Proline rich 16 n=1 Tax=Electrophorus electricus TaxID=8005 RepID=A0A4W4EX32_ELEEL
MSGTTHVESEGVSKVQVKRQIKTIVEDLENILGDLKEVAKELKEVVHEIDSLTSDLQLEEEMADSSKTDTLNSSSSSTTTTTTASSIDKIKVYPEDASIRPPAINPGLLTVLKRPHLPLPPPLRLMSSRSEDHSKGLSSGSLTKNRCPQVTRERVRFSETVQYHGYCPDCDLQYDMSNTDVHLHAELISAKLSPVHQCSSLSPTHKTILRKSTTTTV